MKMKEIVNKNNSDLNRLITEKREALRAFRFGSAGSKTKNVKEGRGIRKDIARIMTELANVKVKMENGK
ncbi:MAG: 50S ribosomal protein L29 [Candidatus Taylorbacteria bacterium]